MKQFLLFGGVKDSSKGGWEDFKGDFDSAQEARNAGDRISIQTSRKQDEWMHVINTETKEFVLTYDGYAGGKWKKVIGTLWIDNS